MTYPPYNSFHRGTRSWQDFFLSTSDRESTEFPSPSPSKIPTAVPSEFPTGYLIPPHPNQASRNSAINNTLTILILLSIIFCFIWYVVATILCLSQNQIVVTLSFLSTILTQVVVHFFNPTLTL